MADDFKAGDPQQPEIRIDTVNGWLDVGELSGQPVRLIIQCFLTGQGADFTQSGVDFVLQFAKLPVTPGKELLTNSPEVRHNFRIQVLFFLTEVFSKTVVFPYPDI
jgi:hypothetical protein